MVQRAHFLRELTAVDEAADTPFFIGRIHDHEDTLLAGDVFRPWKRQLGLQLVEEVLGVGHGVSVTGESLHSPGCNQEEKSK